jgi:acetyltransferase-like isoleucine patch superfamily enzyme
MKERLIERFITGLGKHKTFSLDTQLTTRDQLLLLRQTAVWASRGLWWRIWFKQARGLVFIGSHVKIRYAHHLQVGKNFIVEDGAEIMALSSEGIICGDNVTIGAYATIKPSSYYGRNLGVGLKIGDNSNIGRYSYIGCSGPITIGNNVMMGPRVSLFAENHNFADVERPMREQGVTRQPIVIEDDCWLASGAMVLAGVTIKHGSIIAAGSVVTRDVPPYSVVAGSPATVIRCRLPEEQDALT